MLDSLVKQKQLHNPNNRNYDRLDHSYVSVTVPVIHKIAETSEGPCRRTAMYHRGKLRTEN